MSVTLTETAEAELGTILAFIAERDGLSRAVHVHGKFSEAFEKLERVPGMWSVRSHLTGETIRWWPVFKFLVLYEPVADGIMVMRIVHGARNLDAIFATDDS